eukprot:TRINITY_DN36862_c0_g1_i1.p2 TRINITY_DN36862_c0_g1~~TRINITY_DN36862_c0_g1_i1.p2  ORF type:complete len:172 (-),score=27.11 TRINITY_DN36862_c0_g1_i1:14-529(-)
MIIIKGDKLGGVASRTGNQGLPLRDGERARHRTFARDEFDTAQALKAAMAGDLDKAKRALNESAKRFLLPIRWNRKTRQKQNTKKKNKKKKQKKKKKKKKTREHPPFLPLRVLITYFPSFFQKKNLTIFHFFFYFFFSIFKYNNIKDIKNYQDGKRACQVNGVKFSLNFVG